MRIIINIRDGRRDNRRAVAIDTQYQFSEDDSLRIRNAGVEIYEILRDGFDRNLEGAVVTHRGEAR